MVRPGRRFPIVCLALLLLAGCSPGRLGEAARVLADLDTGAGPSALKDATPRPEHRAIGYAVAGRSYGGDLYVPGETARAAMVLVPGVAAAGKDDPLLVAFAETLARARFRVLVPELANLRRLQVRPEDVRAIADAAVWLAGDGPAGRPLGVAAVSYAVGPAVAALFEPEAGEAVDFVLAIGGYYDLTAVVTFFTTGYYREGPAAAWRHRPPNAYGKWVFVESNLGRLADPGDRARLGLIKEMRLRDAAADVSPWAAELGPEGRAVYDLLANADADRVPALIAALPAVLRADLAALDPSRRDLGRLSQRFFLVHGRDDPIIPETESVKLARALPKGRADLFLVDSLDHVNPKPIGLADRLTLLGAIYGILDERDRTP